MGTLGNTVGTIQGDQDPQNLCPGHQALLGCFSGRSPALSLLGLNVGGVHAGPCHSEFQLRQGHRATANDVGSTYSWGNAPVLTSLQLWALPLSVEERLRATAV